MTPPTPPTPTTPPTPPVPPVGTESVFLTERIWSNAEHRQHLLNAFSQSNDPRFIAAIDILQSYVTQEQPNLTGLQAQLSQQVPTLNQALTDASNQTVLQALETNIVATAPGAGAPTQAVAEIFINTTQRYGGAGRVGNATTEIVRIGNGYVQQFNFGGAGAGAILYGNANPQGVFLAGEEWQEFQAKGGVLVQGYPTQNKLPVQDSSTPVIELPVVNPMPTVEGGGNPNGGESAIAQPLNGLISPNDSTDTAGNTTSTARNISLGQTISERVSDTDLEDFYRFNVSDRTRVDLRISGMSADADLFLLDANGNQIDVSGNGGSVDDALSRELDAGTYFVKVRRYSGSTNYNLTTAGQVVDTAGNTTSTARNITLGQTISERVSDADTDDFYRFNVSDRTRVDLRIAGMSADADLSLLDANGNFIGGSSLGGSADDALTRELDAGTYFVKVSRFSNNSTNYNLITAGQVVDTAGNTTSTARNITLGQTISERVSDTDLEDFYRFNVSDRTRVDLRISGMSADADLFLLDANGNQIAGSSASGSVDDAINNELEAGTYFVKVRRYSGSTNYNLITAGQLLDTAGNTTSTARNITLGQTISERVSDTDTDDFYRFNVNQRTRVDLRISGMSADADLSLLDANGNFITGSSLGGSLDDALTRELDAGTYFVKVSRFNTSNTNYNLTTAGQIVQTNRPPVVSALNQSVHLNRSMIPAFTATDPDQNPITRYRFQDLNGTAGSGYFTVNGITQNANQSIEIAANQLNTVRFVGGNAIGSNSVQVAAFDGQVWGNWTNFNIATTNNAPVVSATTPQTVNINQTILSPFTVSDPDGDAVTSYFFDGNSSTDSGYFTLNGIRQSANQYIPVTSQQMSSLRWVGGSVPGEDNISVTAFDGNLWSNWSNFALVTDTAGNTRSQARSISLGQSVGEYVSSNDQNDFYQFTVNSPGRVRLGLSGMTADADLELQDANGNRVTGSNIRGTGNDSLEWNLPVAGTYFVRVNQFSGSTNYNLTTNWQATAVGPRFTSFSATDASGDGTSNAVFQHGALQLNWATDVPANSVRTFARNNTTGAVTELFYDSNRLVNLNNSNQNIAAGNYTIYAEARDASGNIGRSPDVPMRVLAFNPLNANSKKVGGFNTDTHTFFGASEGSVFIGRGGNDTLAFSGINSSNVTFDPNRRTVFGGTTFDWLRINSTGQEIYFQGYDRLQFSNTTMNLGVTPNDPLFPQQWNLQMMDVPGAWRFTTGSDNVILGNIDSGLNTVNRHQDINFGRTTLYSAQAHDDSTGNWHGHGTGVQGIMAANTNNGIGLAGINWSSQTYVVDIGNSADSIGGTGGLTAMSEYIRPNTDKRVVANNSWSSNTPLVPDTEQGNVMNNVNTRERALYMFSSGNDYRSSINYPSGWAQQLNNVISVGAVSQSGYRHDYSNYGTGLTLVAPGGVPSTRMPTSTVTDSQGIIYDVVSDPRYFPLQAVSRADGRTYTFSGFGGTSSAAPNASGVASLVWSANTNLVASDIKSILTGTANRVWQSWGGYNSDNQYGAGLIDAEAAVRRANALNLNSNVASLYSNEGLLYI
ncbi:pre-peptidase C-terminal domain-containing protein [Microcoleus sp. herbarium8]|uniref:pre-peptidase C-terminal domain-containing protein n=1 Tax=Microcoleus sp. herbarium8 TaxID=3055436 RepID=UPI002FCFA559